MILLELVEEYLKTNGYDGLCHSETGCGCRRGDLMPCGEPSPNCQPGYSVQPPKDSDADFWISPLKGDGDER